MNSTKPVKPSSSQSTPNRQSGKAKISMAFGSRVSRAGGDRGGASVEEAQSKEGAKGSRTDQVRAQRVSRGNGLDAKARQSQEVV